jgi:multidrug efflux pump
MPPSPSQHLCRRERGPRPWIHHLLERAIAAADGIDYIESSSRLGVSTITIRPAHYDANKAFRNQFQSGPGFKRPSARSRSPVINIESADRTLRPLI